MHEEPKNSQALSSLGQVSQARPWRPFDAIGAVAKLDPDGRVVAALLPAADFAVDFRRFQSRRRRTIEEQMIEPEAGVAAVGIPEIIPEGVDGSSG